MNDDSAALTLEELRVRGETLGRQFPTGSVVSLEGPLGAGKTTLAQAILLGRGVAGLVASPTYALVHHHEGLHGACYHLDCYRLRHPDEAADLDWDTLLQADLLLIEWPERAGAWMPHPTHSIRLDYADAERRAMVMR